MMDEQTFQQIQAYLVRKSGLCISADRQSVLEEKISMRLQPCGLKTMEQYWQYLQFNAEGPKELKNLIDLLTIGETYFFRNQAQFKALREMVLPQAIQKKAGKEKSLKIWCAGCSTGEEPYSIAILLNELGFFDPSWKISILATDINRNSLDLAREAIYSPRAVHEMPQDLIDRYFVERGRKFELCDEIKNKVQFRRHNLVADEYEWEEMQQLDLILCRNVTIYFDLPTTKRLMAQFSKLLIPGAHLFIGHAETLWGISEDFDAVEFPETFVYRKCEAGKSKPVLNPKKILPRKLLQEFAVQKKAVPKNLNLHQNSKIQKPASIPADAANKVQLNALFEEAQNLANQEKYEKSLQILEQVIAQDNLCIQAYHLMGVLLMKLGQCEAAVEVFRKLLYIDGSLILSHFHLAKLYQSLHNKAQAEKEYLNCLKLLEASDESDLVPFLDGLTAGVVRQAVQTAYASLKG